MCVCGYMYGRMSVCVCVCVCVCPRGTVESPGVESPDMDAGNWSLCKNSTQLLSHLCIALGLFKKTLSVISTQWELSGKAQDVEWCLGQWLPHALLRNPIFFCSSVSPQSNDTGLLAELHPSMVSFSFPQRQWEWLSCDFCYFQWKGNRGGQVMAELSSWAFNYKSTIVPLSLPMTSSSPVPIPFLSWTGEPSAGRKVILLW